jgi:hypothetical protein
MIIQGSPEILQGPRGLNNQFGSFAEVPSDSVALELFYRASTVGAPTAEFNKYGGYAAVKAIAEAAGYGATTEFIQNYEIVNALPESASTILNKQFLGAEGVAKFAAIEAAYYSEDAALAKRARDLLIAQAESAEAQFQSEEAARASANAANTKIVSDAYAKAQAASKAAADAKTLKDKQAADALRERALVAVKALYLLVLNREGDQEGLDYFADRFGDVIDPEELQIFKDMSKPEIDAKNKYLADIAAKIKEDAAKAKTIADQFSAKAAAANTKANAAAAVVNTTDITTTTAGTATTTAGGGISPALILAAAAAAFFIGG